MMAAQVFHYRGAAPREKEKEKKTERVLAKLDQNCLYTRARIHWRLRIAD